MLHAGDSRLSNIEARRAASRRFYLNHKEDERSRAKRWAANNKEKRNAYMREWNRKSIEKDELAHRLKARNARLRRKYGVTLRQYDALLKAQGGRCALCDRRPEQERYKVLHVDHCHYTGKIRGLLCNAHNLSIGRLGDTEKSISMVLSYLQGNR